MLQLYSFIFSPKTSYNPFTKLTRSIIQPLFKIKIFWTITRIFAKIFLAPSPDHFGRWGKCHDITKSVSSKTNNKPLDNDSMAAEFYKNVYQDLSPKQLQTEDLRKQESINKSQIGWRQILVPSLPCRNKVWVIAVKNYTEADFKVS